MNISKGAIASILLLGAGTMSATTVGNPLTNGSFSDTCVGCYFVLNAPFPAGETVTGWSIFSNINAGNQITPFLIDISTDIITGIGTTQTNAASGIQAFSFGLVSGTALAGANTRFGFRDGTTSAGNSGSIKFDFIAQSATAGYWGTVPASFSVGTNLGAPVSADSGRYYSLQVVSTAPPTGVPEPSTWLLTGAGLAFAGLGTLRRRRSLV